MAAGEAGPNRGRTQRMPRIAEGRLSFERAGPATVLRAADAERSRGAVVVRPVLAWPRPAPGRADAARGVLVARRRARRTARAARAIRGFGDGAARGAAVRRRRGGAARATRAETRVAGLRAGR